MTLHVHFEIRIPTIGQLWRWSAQHWPRALSLSLAVVLTLTYTLSGPLGGRAPTSQAANDLRPMATHSFSVAPKAKGVPLNASKTVSRPSAAQLKVARDGTAMLHSLKAPKLGMSNQKAVDPASLNRPSPAPARLNGAKQAAPTGPLADGEPVVEQFNTSTGGGGAASPCALGFCSTVAEPSVAGDGAHLFETYNSFALVSPDGGTDFLFDSPFTQFTGIAGVGDFCCDQQVLYEPSRDRFWWEQLYLPGTGPRAGNPAGLGLATDSGTFSTGWCFFYVTAATFGYATTDLLEFPDIEFTNDNMFLSFNVYTSGSAWVASDVARFGLTGPSSCTSFGGSVFATSTNFQYALTQGAQGTMWFVSDALSSGTGSNLNICQWQDPQSSPSCVTRAIPAFNYLTSGSAYCASQDGVVQQWCNRLDSSARSAFFTKANFRGFGPATLGVALTVGPAGSDPFPWVAIYYFEVAGLVYTAEDALFNNTYAIAYPSFAPNFRGWMGFSAAIGGGTGSSDIFPSTMFGLYDPANPTPPFLDFFYLGSGNATDWGDYNTTRPLYPSALPFISGVWALDASGNILPGEFIYDRVRDHGAYLRWQLL